MLSIKLLSGPSRITQLVGLKQFQHFGLVKITGIFLVALPMEIVSVVLAMVPVPPPAARPPPLVLGGGGAGPLLGRGGARCPGRGGGEAEVRDDDVLAADVDGDGRLHRGGLRHGRGCWRGCARPPPGVDVELGPPSRRPQLLHILLRVRGLEVSLLRVSVAKPEPV